MKCEVSRMEKKKLCDVALVVLCVSGILTNHFLEQYKILSIACMLGMGVIALIKERIE